MPPPCFTAFFWLPNSGNHVPTGTRLYIFSKRRRAKGYPFARVMRRKQLIPKNYGTNSNTVPQPLLEHPVLPPSWVVPYRFPLESMISPPLG
jgi:hypothetical protein